MAERRVPRIRFKGFEEDWEQRKLADLADSFEYGLNVAAKDYDGKNKYIRITDIDDSTHEFLRNDLTTPDADLPQSGNYKLHYGDILFARTGASVGKTYIYKEFDGLVYYAGFLIRAKIKREEDPEFVFQNTLTPDYDKYIRITSQRSGQPGVNAQEYGEYSLMVPVLQEQKKIGTFLRDFDTLLSLHQRKLEKLKILKKAMLEKMFPKNGAKVPEIRFSGFTEDWEQRKLEEYLVVSVEKNLGGVYGKADVLSVSGDYGIVNQIEFQGRSFAGASVLQYGVVHTGDVVYTKSPLSSNPYGIIKTNRGAAGIVSTLYAVYRPLSNITSEFVQLYFEQNARMNNYMHPLVNKGAKNDMKVSASNALKGVVKFPSKSEQKNICRYFDSIDSVITLHQRKPF